MKIPINLASEPFRRDRAMLVASAAVAVLLMASLGVLFALVLIYPVFRRVGLAWGVLVLINLLPPLITGGFLSMGRMTSTLFPLFYALAVVIPPRAVPGWAAAFGIGQGLCAALFFTWRALF